MKTKFFTLFLALVCAAQVFAHDFEVNGIYYNLLGGDSVEVTSGSYSGSVTIPETVVYNSTTYRVTAIGNHAFYGRSSLTTVTIPNSVTTIGDHAFYACSGLTQTNYTGDLASWCKIQFGGWEANPITYSHNLYINGTSITKADIPEGVTSISQYAFYGLTPLAEVTIPNSVTTIGEGAFCYCSCLTAVTWNAKNCEDFNDSYYAPFYGISSQITSFTFGNEVEHIPAYLCYGMSNLTSITIPNSVTSIGNDAFSDCSSLTAVTWNANNYKDFSYPSDAPFYDISSQITFFTFGNEVEHIPACLCYRMSNLTSITIPNSVTTIGESAFSDCSSLTQTNYTGDLASWCKIDFSYYSNPIFYSHNLYINGQSITKADIPEGVTSISRYAFYGLTPLTEVTIPNSVTTIGSEAFFGCSSLTEITIPNSVTFIGNDAFFDCSSLTAVTWNAKNCEDFNDSYYASFYGISSQITSFTFGNEVENIPASLCKDMSSLATVTIPESVTTIGESAFEGCSNLTSIAIPNNVTLIGRYAFSDCGNITKFICQSATMNTDAGESFVLANTGLDTVIAPASFFDLDENYWSGLAKNIRYIEVNAGEVTADAFAVINRSFDKLQTLDISATTNTEITNNAFKGCYKLETLLLPKELETIGYMSFAECVSLKALDIPATVTEIGDRAFEDCRSIKTLTFGGQQPASAPAFEETHHRRVSTASTSALQRIGNWAFYNCHELQHLEIPEGVTEIGAAAFYGCTYLEDLTLPASVQAIGDNCFALCSKLNKITCLATTPPTIEAKTFYDVKRSIPLYVPEASINDYANDTYWSEFINTQAAPETTTGFSLIMGKEADVTRKVLENGVLYIIRDGEKYTIDGRKVE